MDDQFSMLKEILSSIDNGFIVNETTPPRVIKEKCTGCGICVKECPSLVIEMIDDKASHVNKTYCVECEHCTAVCPAGAIEDPLAEQGDYTLCKPEDLPDSTSLQSLFRARRSVRFYKDEPLSREILEKIIEAGRYAPTGGNRPDVHYLVLSTPEEVARLRGPVLEYILKLFSLLKSRSVFLLASIIGGKENMQTVKFYLPWLEFSHELWEKHGIDRIFYHAPAVIIVHGKKMDPTIPFSCATALYQASFMAHTLNIGCCFNGFLQVAISRNSRIKKMLGIPKGHKCFGAMTLGYPKWKYHRLVRRREAQVTWR